ncbi:MAG: hypothetical protein C4589_06310 [Peptococcaceae bacterium]|nr:MAG: hypothetical protein C4589_06310 [Peptococcaceae bacterium]
MCGQAGGGNRRRGLYSFASALLPSRESAGWSRLLMLLPFGFYLALAVGLACARRPWCDEAWFASSAVNLARHGFMGNTCLVSEGIWQNLDHYTYWQPPVYFLMEALTFKLFGIGLLQVRLISIFWGLAGLAAVYCLAGKLFNGNRRVVFLSTLLVGTNFYYLRGAADGRMDLTAASLSLIGFTFYLVLREKNFGRAVFLGHLFVCLSGLVHPNGVLGLFVLLFLIVYLDRRKISPGVVLAALVPYLLGAAGWGAYILQDAAAFKSQFFGSAFRPETATCVNGLKWAAVYAEMAHRYFGLVSRGGGAVGVLAYAAAPFWAFLFAGLAGSFVLKDKRLWYMLVLYFLGLMFFIANKTSCYLVWIVPLFLLNLAGVGYAVRWKGFFKLIPVVAFSYVILFSVGGAIYAMAQNNYRNQYLSDLKCFTEQYYRGGKIYGRGELAFFFNFDDSIVQDDARLGYYSAVKPRYFVVDDDYRRWFERFKKEEPAVWEHVERNLKQDYSEIFTGNYYTFYERIP